MSDLRPAAIAVAVLGFFSGALTTVGRFMPVIVERASTRIGMAIAAVNALDFLLSPVAVAIVGYGAGRRVDVSEAWPRIAGLFGLLGAAAALVGVVAVTLAFADDLVRTAGLSLVGSLLAIPFGTGVSFLLTGLAAAAVGHFRAS